MTRIFTKQHRVRDSKGRSVSQVIRPPRKARRQNRNAHNKPATGLCSVRLGDTVICPACCLCRSSGSSSGNDDIDTINRKLIDPSDGY